LKQIRISSSVVLALSLSRGAGRQTQRRERREIFQENNNIIYKINNLQK